MIRFLISRILSVDTMATSAFIFGSTYFVFLFFVWISSVIAIHYANINPETPLPDFVYESITLFSALITCFHLLAELVKAVADFYYIQSCEEFENAENINR